MVKLNTEVSNNKCGLMNNAEIKKIFSQIFKRFLKENESFKSKLFSEVYLSIYFVSPEEMGKINLKYRKENKSTDVISLRYWKNEKTIEFLGEIYVDFEYIQADHLNTEYVSYTLKQYLILMFIHSFLHLAGYDHETEEEHKVMFELQSKIFLDLIK